MKRFALTLATAAIALTPVAASAQVSQTAPQPTPAKTGDTQQQLEQPEGLTGDWGGLRTRLRDRGIDISLGIISEVAANVSGGARHDVTQVSGFALGAALDTGKLFGLQGGTFQAILTKRQGPALINRARLNTLMPTQEIYARGQTYRLSDFWYRQRLGAGADLKIGRMTMGEDFATLPCDFMNLTFCGNPVGNLVGNYWYNGPISQWAGRLRMRPGAFSLMVGIYEYNPNNLKQSVALSHGGAKGVTVPIEAGWMPRLGPRRLPGSYRVGAWYNSGDGDDLLTGADGRPFAATGLDPVRRRGRYGAYVLLQQQLTGSYVEDGANGARTTQGLSIFANYTQADRRTTRTDGQLAFWLVDAGPFAARPSDDLGIGIGRTNVNSRAAEAEGLLTPGSERPHAEYTAELYYGVHVLPGLMVRPNVQYIVDPGGYRGASDVVVLGLKTAITL
jgi:porin